MAGCDIAAGRIEPCKDSIGGLDAIYFVNDGDLTGYTMMLPIQM